MVCGLSLSSVGASGRDHGASATDLAPSASASIASAAALSVSGPPRLMVTAPAGVNSPGVLGYAKNATGGLVPAISIRSLPASASIAISAK